MGFRRKCLLSAAVVAALSIVLVMPARAQSPNQAGLVVMHGDGRVLTRCVEFSEPEITGYDLLARSGLSLSVNFGAGAGGAVCALDGAGCSEADCFCECRGTPCRYWIYHHLLAGQWTYANLGASLHTVRPGDIDGWAWGEGTVSGGVQPPVIPFEQICPVGVAATATTSPPAATRTTAPTPTPTVTFTAEPSPTPADTAIPVSATSTPTRTTVPSDTPTVAPSPSASPIPSANVAPDASPARPPEPAQAGARAIDYVAFGGIVLALSVGLVVSARRRG